MGRPKGSKNKPKVESIPATDNTVEKKAKRPNKAAKVILKPQPHIVFQFTDYVFERMDGLEIDYYKRMARKKERPIKYLLAKALLDFFRIQDQQLDISVLLEQPISK